MGYMILPAMFGNGAATGTAPIITKHCRKRLWQKKSEGPEDSYDPAEPGLQKRVQRGGSFLCTDQYCTRYMLGTRGKGEYMTSTNHTGFRCVMDTGKTDVAKTNDLILLLYKKRRGRLCFLYNNSLLFISRNQRVSEFNHFLNAIVRKVALLNSANTSGSLFSISIRKCSSNAFTFYSHIA